jgi:hypothetical protein
MNMHVSTSSTSIVATAAKPSSRKSVTSCYAELEAAIALVRSRTSKNPDFEDAVDQCAAKRLRASAAQ